MPGPDVSTGDFLKIALGALAGYFARALQNRRSLFTYTVAHNKIGESSKDPLFGQVQITWNQAELGNLYLSTVEITNQSLTDFENFTIRICAPNTTLMGERTEIVGTTEVLGWDADFLQQYRALKADPAGGPTALGFHLRVYAVPTLLRGQSIRIVLMHTFTGGLVADVPPAQQALMPVIFPQIQHKGIRLKEKRRSVLQTEILGVPWNTTIPYGLILAIALVAATVRYVENLWLATGAIMVITVFCGYPVAAFVRFWRWARSQLFG